MLLGIMLMASPAHAIQNPKAADPIAIQQTQPAAPHLKPRTTTLSTTTTLATTPAGTAAWPDTVTLTATVKDANHNPVTSGTILFCNGTTLCRANIGPGSTGILGAAQLTTAGTAAIKVFLAPATYSALTAAFLGTDSDHSSTSTPAAALFISGKTPTAATLTSIGNPGNYSLTATLTGGGIAAPGGLISFLDTSNSNASIATSTLDPTQAVPQFLLAASPVVGTGPHSIAIADFNHDGYPDLAVANYGEITVGTGNTVSILLGNGTGSYAVTSTLTVDAGVSSIAAGDFNNDGIPDLAVTSYQNNNVTILQGNGDGTFTALSTLVSTGAGPWSISTGDFNNDGNLDLAITNSINTVAGATQYGSVSLLLGAGDGTFTLAATPAVGNTPVESAVGDFNNDGNLDLVVANQDSDDLTLLFGDGSGNFSSESAIAVGTEPVTVLVSDFNLDGNADIATGNFIDGTVTVLLGDGTGNFAPSTNSPFAAGSGPQTARAGDFNNDGLPDLVVSDGNGNNFTVLIGDATGNFTQPNSPAPTGTEPFYFAAADLNGDGMTDLVAANLGSASLTVLLGQWSGTTAVNNLSVSATGSHLIDAAYPGDATHLASLSNTVPLLGSLTATTTSLTGSPASEVFAGQTLQLTAQIAPNTFYTFTATGVVTFYDNGVFIGEVNLGASGGATITTSALAAGQHSFLALYSGDTDFTTSTSPALSYLVTVPTITATTTTTSYTVQQSMASTPSIISIAAQGGYTGNVTLQCGNVPQFALCELSPAAISITADGNYSATFSLQTSGYYWTLPSGAGSTNSGNVQWSLLFFTAGFAYMRRRARKMQTLFTLLVLLCGSGLLCSSGLLGCSGKQAEFTPAGTYTVPITVRAANYTQTLDYTIKVVPLQ